MLIINNGQLLRLSLGEAASVNQCDVYAGWRLMTASAFTPESNFVASNDTSNVTLVADPGVAGTAKVIDFINVHNRDTIAHTVNIQEGSSGIFVFSGSIGAGERLSYTSADGFKVYDAFGRAKILQTTQSSLPTDTNVTILGSDVVNNNAVANTIQDVTGLSFPVVAGEMYWFKFDIAYTAALATTGSRWSVNGPAAPTRLCYMSEYSLAATTTTRNANNISYDLPAASNASSSSTGSNRAEVEGIIQPSASGTVIARFASEVAGSAITALAGSRVQWMRTI